MNPILLTDSYKVSHHRQYPPGTQSVYSYFESRGGNFPDVVFFGLQYYLNTYFTTPITREDIDEAEEMFAAHFGSKDLFNRKGWEHILNKHGGKLPLRIKAVPEGMVIPTRNVMMTVENTDPECFWLTNYMETILVQVWYPCTVATQSRAMKRTLLNYALRTGGDLQGVNFKLHDFGYRGSTSVESAGIGGAAHLVNFMGTDTFAALQVARNHYGAHMAGFSIPAAEHSTITSWGKDNEVAAFKNMLEKFPKGLVAVVSDSFDVYNACENLWGDQLKSMIEQREGTLVVRPDSGHPPEVVCRVLDILGKKFGYTEKTVQNSKYKTLPPYIRVIQGDGIDIHMMDDILFAMKNKGWSTDNIAFGSGGGLLQKVNRDTCKFAFKCSDVVINGEHRDVSKDPITDPGKKSKAGRLRLIRVQKTVNKPNGFETAREYDDFTSVQPDVLQTVYENGEILKRYSFDEIRKNAEIVQEAQV